MQRTKKKKNVKCFVKQDFYFVCTYKHLPGGLKRAPPFQASG